MKATVVEQFLVLFLINSSLVMSGCKLTSNSSNHPEVSTLQDVKITFPGDKLPWKQSIPAEDRKKAVADMKLSFSASNISHGKNCTEFKEQNANIPSSGVISIQGFKLTVDCEYRLELKLSNKNEVYFQTDESSIRQVMPKDGVIANYKICLAFAGNLFDDTIKNVSCVSSSSSGSTDATITPSFGGETPNEKTGFPFDQFATLFGLNGESKTENFQTLVGAKFVDSSWGQFPEASKLFLRYTYEPLDLSKRANLSGTKYAQASFDIIFSKDTQTLKGLSINSPGLDLFNSKTNSSHKINELGQTKAQLVAKYGAPTEEQPTWVKHLFVYKSVAKKIAVQFGCDSNCDSDGATIYSVDVAWLPKP